MAGATVSESDIRFWFKSILQYLRDNNLEDILKDPRRILNGDETSFHLDPITKAVVASKGNRNVYLVQHADPKKNVTVLCTFDADGYMFPPDVILPYKRLPTQLVMSFDPEWGIGKSDKGWMDGDNFMASVQNIVLPSLLRRNVQLPVIYFVDGHSSHTGSDVAELCADLGIILIALYPNATHIMQPADVAIFKPLKNSWSNCVDEWRMNNNGRMFTIDDFAGVLKEAINRSVSPSIVRSGFRKCGLYPFNADAVDYSRCIASSNPTQNGSNSFLPENETVSVELNKINDALRVINATNIKSLVDVVEERSLDDSEKALLHIYKSILSDFDTDTGIEKDLNENIVLRSEDNEATTESVPLPPTIDEVVLVLNDDEATTESPRHAPLSSTMDDFMLEITDAEAEQLLSNSDASNQSRSCQTANVTVETVDDWSTFQSSIVSCEVQPVPEHSSTTRQEDWNVMIVNPTDASDLVEPADKPQEGVLSDIANIEKPHRRISISSFFNLPPTPKRKNVKRNYSSKRHFVLTSSERLQVLKEKEEEKQRLIDQKELKRKERAMKKEFQEQEKQERIRIREQKKKERELDRRLKEKAKKSAKPQQSKPPKKVRKRTKCSDENADTW